jgi:competence protein ComFC
MKRTRAQFRLSPLQRQQNLVGAFTCNRDLKGKKILLIDDVITTGATAHECAKVLKESGAIWVGLLAFAGTPR